MTSATTPLAGTEVLPVVQSSTTKQVSVADLTAGRNVATANLDASGYVTQIRSDSSTSFTGSADPASVFATNTSSTTGSYAGYGIEAKNAGGLTQVAAILAQTTASGYSPNLIIGVRTASSTFTQRVQLTGSSGDFTLNSGNLVIGTSGKGIDFSITPDPSGMTSELLADYEEGTWTPVIGGDGGTSGQSYSTQNGKYVKVGKLVTVSCDVRLSTKGTITGNVILSGLPYTVTSGDYYGGGTANLIQNLGAATSMVAFHAIPSSTTAYAQKSNNNTSSAYMATADITNTTWFFITMSYIST